MQKTTQRAEHLPGWPHPARMPSLGPHLPGLSSKGCTALGTFWRGASCRKARKKPSTCAYAAVLSLALCLSVFFHTGKSTAGTARSLSLSLSVSPSCHSLQVCQRLHQEHFVDCTSKSFPKYRAQSPVLCCCYLVLNMSPVHSFWHAGLPIHAGKCLYPKPGKEIHVSKTSDSDTFRSEASQEKEIHVNPLLRALLRCLGVLP